MPKRHFKYYPNLSIEENAIKNECSIGAVRYYIRNNSIDRRAEQTAKTIIKLRDCYQDGKPLCKIAEEAGYSINTVKRYLPYILTEDEPSKIGQKKRQKLTVRQKNEYYATDPSVTRDLLRNELFVSPILEPCCGGGFMAEEIKKAGYLVEACDLIDRGYGRGGVDFITHDFPIGQFDIITNPPYSDFVPMLNKAMAICRSKVAMLLPLRYLTSQERYNCFKQYPPKCVYVYIERICIAKGGKFEEYEAGMNMEMYAWYVWEKGFSGEPILRWIHNNR